MEERLHTLTTMARKVSSTNPAEGKAVRDRQSEITALWENLKVRVFHSTSVLFTPPLHFVQAKAASRKVQLDNAFLLQTFLANSKELVSSTPLNNVHCTYYVCLD